MRNSFMSHGFACQETDLFSFIFTHFILYFYFHLLVMFRHQTLLVLFGTDED